MGDSVHGRVWLPSEGLEAGVLGAKAGWGEGLVVEVKVVGWEGVARARRR